MPIEQYMRDQRIMRGVQRGVGSFTGSTALAALDLIGQVVYAIQSTAQFAHDIVTPTSHHQRLALTHGAHRHRSTGASGGQHHHNMMTLNNNYCFTNPSLPVAQPRDLREGVNAAYVVASQGIQATARNVSTAVMSAEGTAGQIGAVVSTAPSAMIEPVIVALQTVDAVRVGLRNQINKEARQNDQDKYKSQ